MKLQMEGLSKSFGDKNVLTEIKLEAESGLALGLLGRNGAGKTTAIRILMGLFPSDSGRITVDGVPINRDKLNIGYLPEERGLYMRRQILEQMIYFGGLRGLSKQEAKKRTLAWLERLDMLDYKDKKLDTLSKGNQQKIQLAASLLSDPDIIVLDEPFSGLDPVNATLLKNVVSEQIAAGKLVFFSSHQMNYIEEFCQNIAILNQGKIVLSGVLRDIKRSYERNKILLMSSSMNPITQLLKDGSVAPLIKKITAHNDSLLVELHEVSQKRDLFAALAARGIDVDEFKVYEPTLSDIFVQYTEDAV